MGRPGLRKRMREAEYTYTVEDDSSTSSLTDNDKCDAKKAKTSTNIIRRSMQPLLASPQPPLPSQPSGFVTHPSKQPLSVSPQPSLPSQPSGSAQPQTIPSRLEDPINAGTQALQLADLPPAARSDNHTREYAWDQDSLADVTSVDTYHVIITLEHESTYRTLLFPVVWDTISTPTIKSQLRRILLPDFDTRARDLFDRAEADRVFYRVVGFGQLTTDHIIDRILLCIDAAPEKHLSRLTLHGSSFISCSFRRLQTLPDARRLQSLHHTHNGLLIPVSDREPPQRPGSLEAALAYSEPFFLLQVELFEHGQHQVERFLRTELVPIWSEPNLAGVVKYLAIELKLDAEVAANDNYDFPISEWATVGGAGLVFISRLKVTIHMKLRGDTVVREVRVEVLEVKEGEAVAVREVRNRVIRV